MALRPNATMVFSSHEGTDDGILLTFLCPDPGPGEFSFYRVRVTDSELLTVNTGAEFRALALAKLQRKFRALAKLDAVIGQSVVI